MKTTVRQDTAVDKGKTERRGGHRPGIRVFRIILGLFGLALSAGAVTPVWVDATFTSGGANGGHTWGTNAFSSIQAGINAVSAGGTVNVAPGTYSEVLTVTSDKTGLTLQGNGGMPLINPALGSTTYATIIKVLANSVTLRGLELASATGVQLQGNGRVLEQHGVWDGSWTVGSSNLTVDGCKIHDVAHGVRSYGDNVRIVNNEMYSLGLGGASLSGPTGTPLSMTVRNNWFHDWSQYDKEGGAVYVKYNGRYGEVSYNYIAGMRMGLAYYYGGPTGTNKIIFAHNTIDTCFASGAPVTTKMGLSLYGTGSNPANIVIRDNLFLNATWYAIYQEGATIAGAISIDHNLFYNNNWFYAADPAYQYPNQWFGSGTYAAAGWSNESAGNAFAFTNDRTGQDPALARTGVVPRDFYALQTGSPALGAASDGGNIGAWQAPLWTMWVNDDWAGTAVDMEVAPGKIFGFNAFSTIQAAINAAASGSTINVEAGTYAEAITIDRPLTLTGDAGGATPVINLPAGTAGVVTIQASNVSVNNLHIGKADQSSDTANLNIARGGTWPNYTIACENVTLRNLVVEKGRRAAFVTARNVTIQDCQFLDQYRDSLYFNAVAGVTNIIGNYFHGDPATSKKAILFENFSDGDPATSGTINIERNATDGKNNFVVYNQWVNPALAVDLNILNNLMAGLGSNAVVVYDPRADIPTFDPANFAKINSMQVHGNSLAGVPAAAYGVRNPIDPTYAVTIDAAGNWWGSVRGPTNAVNPGGDGATVSANVAFSPWLGDGTDTLADIGFQPNGTPVYYTPASLAFSTQPGQAPLGSPLTPQPVVQVLNGIGEVATQFLGTVTVSIANNPGSGALAGTRTVSATNGVALFTDLAITGQGGTGFTLAATATGLPPATSSAFDIVPSINVTGNGLTVASGDASPSAADGSDFGNVSTVNATAAHTFMIENLGVADLILSGNPLVAVSGTAAAEFTVTAPPTSPVAPSGRTTFQVTFAPAEVGLRTALVSIASNDSGRNPYTFAVQGTGLPQPAVTGLTPAQGPVTGGTTVVIAGTDLTDVTAVLFGAVNATSFTIDSATQITAVAPSVAAVGGVNVSVTAPGGTSANTPADDYIYTVGYPPWFPDYVFAGDDPGYYRVTITDAQNTVAATLYVTGAEVKPVNYLVAQWNPTYLAGNRTSIFGLRPGRFTYTVDGFVNQAWQNLVAATGTVTVPDYNATELPAAVVLPPGGLTPAEYTDGLWITRFNITNAAGYKATLTRNGTVVKSNIVILQQNVDGTVPSSRTPLELTEALAQAGGYTMEVTAMNPLAESTPAASYSQTIVAEEIVPPDAPPVAPVAGGWGMVPGPDSNLKPGQYVGTVSAQGQKVTVNFSWNSIAWASGYYVIAVDETGIPVSTMNNVWVTQTTYTATFGAGVYSWCVIPVNAQGYSSWSPRAWFEVKADPVTQGVLDQRPGAVTFGAGDVQFDWTAGAEAMTLTPTYDLTRPAPTDVMLYVYDTTGNRLAFNGKMPTAKLAAGIGAADGLALRQQVYYVIQLQPFNGTTAGFWSDPVRVFSGIAAGSQERMVLAGAVDFTGPQLVLGTATITNLAVGDSIEWEAYVFTANGGLQTLESSSYVYTGTVNPHLHNLPPALTATAGSIAYVRVRVVAGTTTSTWFDVWQQN